MSLFRRRSSPGSPAKRRSEDLDDDELDETWETEFGVRATKSSQSLTGGRVPREGQSSADHSADRMTMWIRNIERELGPLFFLLLNANDTFLFLFLKKIRGRQRNTGNICIVS